MSIVNKYHNDNKNKLNSVCWLMLNDSWAKQVSFEWQSEPTYLNCREALLLNKYFNKVQCFESEK